MEELELARREIDRIDGALAELFEARMACAARIADWKQTRDLPILDPAREAAVIAKNTARLKDPALIPYYTSLLEKLMELSRAYQAARMAEKEAVHGADDPHSRP